MKAVYISKEGTVCFHPAWPEEPNQNDKKYDLEGVDKNGDYTLEFDDFGFYNDNMRYQSALSKAKEEAVPFANQETIKNILAIDHNLIPFYKIPNPKDTFYPLPENVEVEIRCNDGECQLFGCDDKDCKIPKLAYIKESSPQKWSKSDFERCSPTICACQKESDCPSRQLISGVSVKFAYIKSSMKEEKPNPVSSSEEGQEKLWKLALHHSGSQIDPIKWLQKHFTITRNA